MKSTRQEKQVEPFEIARAFTRSIKATNLYPVDHPRVQDQMREVQERLERFFAKHDSFVMGLDNQKLLIQQSLVEDDEILNDQLHPVLEERQIGSLQFERGITKEELFEFLESLSSKQGEFTDRDEQGGAQDHFDHIRINQMEVKYDVSVNVSQESTGSDVSQTVGADEPEADDTSSEAEGQEEGLAGALEERREEVIEFLTEEPDSDEVDELVEQLLSGIAPSDYTNEKKLKSIILLLNTIVGELTPDVRAESREEIQQFFMKLLIEMGLRGNESFMQLIEEPEDGLRPMERSTRQLLFGEEGDSSSFRELFKCVQPDDRGRVIAEEFRAGPPSLDRVSRMIETIAPGGDDLVEVTTSAVREMSHFVSMESESAASELTSLFNALLDNTPYQKPPVRILIADDCEENDRYLFHLAENRYFFDLYRDGGEAREEVTSSDERVYDLVILELKLPGTNGLEILEHLKTRTDPPPVLIYTRYPDFDDAYEIQTYPNCRVIERPMDGQQFLETIENLIGPRKDRGRSTEKKEETTGENLQKARDIQEKLVRTSEPDCPGTTFRIHHRPSGRVNGDYLDIFPVNGQNYLIAFGTVSGSGVSASMVMVILRSILHTLMDQTTNPRELMIRINRMFKEHIDRSMFVRLSLGLYNVQNHSMELVSAGNNDPFFWNETARTASTIGLSGIATGLIGDRRFRDVLQTRTILLNSGDTILFCSDGVIQTHNDNVERFGKERLFDMMKKFGRSGVDELVSGIVSELDECEQSESRTDQTVLAISSRL